MTLNSVVTQQYRGIVDRAATATREISVPKEGWIRTIRKALSMSGAQLARRLGVTRGAVSNYERAEINGGITLKVLNSLAAAMECRLIYAIVPEKDVAGIIDKQASERAKSLLKRTNTHMALESQHLTENQVQQEILRLAEEIKQGKSSRLWADE